MAALILILALVGGVAAWTVHEIRHDGYGRSRPPRSHWPE